jgi:hypothetical protein
VQALRVEWTENRVALVDSVEALDRLLDDLNEEARLKPFMAELQSANSDTMSIGLGRDVSVLSWVQASGDPPYFASKGAGDNRNAVEVFFYRGQWSEFPAWSTIPVGLAREAMRRFFRSGTLPENVTWVEV